MDSENLIGSLKLDLRLSSHGAVKDCEERIDALTDSSVIPVLERLAEEYSRYGIDMDSIEVDLGRIPEEDFSFFLERELRARLDEAVRRLPLPSGVLDDEDGIFSISVENAPVSLTALESSEGRYLQDEALLVRYLEDSEMEWTQSLSDFDPIALLPSVLSDTATTAHFLSRLSQRGLVGLVWLLDAIGQDSLLIPSETIQSGGERPLKDILNQVLSRLQAVSIEQYSKIEARRSQWHGIPEKSEQGNLQRTEMTERNAMAHETIHGTEEHTDEGKNEGKNEDENEDEASAQMVTYPSVSSMNKPEDGQTAMDAQVKKDAPLSSESEREMSLAEASIRQPVMKSGGADSVEASPNPSISEAAGVPSQQSEYPDETAHDPWVDEVSLDLDTEDIPYTELKRLFISDAGLVLVHPFLRHLLRNLGLLNDKGKFVSASARIRSVHLLRQVTGLEGTHYDHCLILEKILCGIPLKTQLPVEWEPTIEESEEVTSMLEALKSYWPPLSKSSVEALRGAFIQRQGSIEKTLDGYLVRVEGSAMDILLDDLPWETSLIVLPWLEKPIFVEWQRDNS